MIVEDNIRSSQLRSTVLLYPIVNLKTGLFGIAVTESMPDALAFQSTIVGATFRGSKRPRRL